MFFQVAFVNDIICFCRYELKSFRHMFLHVAFVNDVIRFFRYELKSFRHGKVRHVTSSDVTLNETIELASDWPNSHHDNPEGRIINYSYNETIYFGKGHNLQTGSDVTLIFENRSQGSHSQTFLKVFLRVRHIF